LVCVVGSVRLRRRLGLVWECADSHLGKTEDGDDSESNEHLTSHSDDVTLAR
jgi:hypothetical protein